MITSQATDIFSHIGVTFEHKAIGKQLDDIELKDLDFDKDEYTVVICLYRAENLHDESVKVENLIAKIVSETKNIPFWFRFSFLESWTYLTYLVTVYSLYNVVNHVND